jgi:hypothetical protein
VHRRLLPDFPMKKKTLFECPYEDVEGSWIEFFLRIRMRRLFIFRDFRHAVHLKWSHVGRHLLACSAFSLRKYPSLSYQ